MARYDGTRFTKAATPTAGGTLNTSNRIIGSNPRKQKLTEAAGTNPSKMGATRLEGGPKPLTPKGSGYAQDSAPHKSLKVEYPFAVGGPGFPENKKI